MNIVSKTDTGLVRTINEDRSVVINNLNGFVLAIVADGMGGHQAGEIASQMAIEVIQEHMNGIESGLSVEECKVALQLAIEKANQTLFEFASGKEQYHGMGTTVVAMLATKEFLVIGHIGDSRAYLIASDQIAQLTEDHSLVSELLRSGQITHEEAINHPRRNVITRALGTDSVVSVELGDYTWQPNDIVLLCSDGLSGQLNNNALLDILQAGRDLQWKADQLVSEALAAGGDDNITVVLLANELSIGGDHP